jgi:hypothetical protein
MVRDAATYFSGSERINMCVTLTEIWIETNANFSFAYRIVVWKPMGEFYVNEKVVKL